MHSLPTVTEIRIASPCPASWEQMQGDDRVRFCNQCQKNVYNLSEMTAAEAAASVSQHEGQPCVRFFMRADGTALMSDCQRGLRWLVWKRLRKRMTWVAIFFAWLFLPACAGGNMVQPKLPAPSKADQTKIEHDPGDPAAKPEQAKKTSE